ncbi:hypothetical protein [Breoghania sp. JC706]|uniref:hypothetical protein n=1 Tax=Breoghania sp. JC706 TaxID=3117732 RepID=UPI00300948DE
MQALHRIRIFAAREPRRPAHAEIFARFARTLEQTLERVLAKPGPAHRPNPRVRRALR